MTDPIHENDAGTPKRSLRLPFLIGAALILGGLLLLLTWSGSDSETSTPLKYAPAEAPTPTAEPQKDRAFGDIVAAPTGPVQPLPGAARMSPNATPLEAPPPTAEPKKDEAFGDIASADEARYEKKPKSRLVLTPPARAPLPDEEGETATAGSTKENMGFRGTGSGGGGQGSGRIHGTGRIADDPIENSGSPAPPTKRTSVSRYPTMEAPDLVPVGKKFSLNVWLQEELGDANVTVTDLKEGTTSDGDGKVTITLDAVEDGKRWIFYVFLDAPAFQFKDERKEITLGHQGDSTKAVFQLEAKPINGEEERHTVTAMLWSKNNGHLANFQREIVVRDPSRFRGEIVSNVSNAVVPVPTLGAIGKRPDLEVYILYENAPELGAAKMIISSAFGIEPFTMRTDPGLAGWLQRKYKTILSLRKSSNPKKLTIDSLEGIGKKLYDQFAPEGFKRVLMALVQRKSVQTIQFKSNSPLIPWELMRPVDRKTGKRLDFLGVEFAVARLHIDNSQNQKLSLIDELRLTSLTAIAPRYKGTRELSGQRRELAALKRMPGFRRIPGRYDALKRLLNSSPSGMIHFAGHGQAKKRSGTTEYSISLEDYEITQDRWDGLVPEMIENHPFFFFNACDVGDAQSTAGFVEGWAPAVLNAGASGYIGGLWPLGDKAAADTAERFYGHISDKLSDGPVPVAQVLQMIRKRFYETGDPTYLAYVYYGRVNLMFTK